MKRALRLGWAVVFGVLRLVLSLGVLCSWSVASAQPTQSKPFVAAVNDKNRVVCSRAEGLPAGVNVWVRFSNGKLFWETPALFIHNLPKDAVVYVYKPDDPMCRRAQSTAKPAASITSTAAPPTQATTPSRTETPKSLAKKEEKATHPSATKSEQPPMNIEAERLDARRRRAKQARKPVEPPRPDAATQADLAKKVNEKPSALSTTKRRGGTTPITTSACSTCGAAQAPAVRLSLCSAATTARPEPAGPASNPKTAPVRVLILNELRAFKNAKGEADKEAHREKLRAHFGSVAASMAESFQVMLGTNDSLGVMFREVLGKEAIQKELLGILEKKYRCAPTMASPHRQVLATLAVASAFEEMDTLIHQRITAIHEGIGKIVRYNLMGTKKALEKLAIILEVRLVRAQTAKAAAFKETNPATRAEGLKKTGAAYAGVLVAIQLSVLYVNIALTTDTADVKGVLSTLWDDQNQNPLAKPLNDFQDDKDIIALTQAALDSDVGAMVAALPAATKRYNDHLKGVDRWIAAIGRGEVLSKKVVKAADILMIAISIYQVAKTPVIRPGGSATPPTIMGLLPGGAALGAAVNVASVTRALEAIQKLVAIGALDGAIVAGLANIGGRPDVALPEFQWPTSPSVQPTPLPGGSSARISTPSGKPDPAAKPTGPRTEIPSDKDNARSFLRENESADAMAREGYKVEQNPPKPPGSRKKPDYKLEGEYADCYAPDKTTSVRNIWTAIEEKVKSGQAYRIVLNLDDWHGDFAALQKQFKDWTIPDLIEVFIVRGGKVTRFFP